MMQKTCVLLSSLMVLIAFILSSKAGLYYGRLYPCAAKQENDVHPDTAGGLPPCTQEAERSDKYIETVMSLRSIQSKTHNNLFKSAKHSENGNCCNEQEKHQEETQLMSQRQGRRKATDCCHVVKSNRMVDNANVDVKTIPTLDISSPELEFKKTIMRYFGYLGLSLALCFLAYVFRR